MIPLRDNVSRRRLTPMNVTLIAANVAVFGYEVSVGGRRADAMFGALGLVPEHFVDLARGAPPWTPITILTSLFLHGSVMHLLGNMLYLYIFGAAVEERLGAARYFWFYLASGVAAGIATVFMAPRSPVPVIGASGAIAGVLGAYFIFYPRGKILTILPLFIFIEFVNVPAVLYLLLWFAAQLYGGLQAQAQSGMAGGVAWWAHVGGFLFGVALAPLIAQRQFRRRAIA
jgi:membrane associated rhomboid family serine protease